MTLHINCICWCLRQSEMANDYISSKDRHILSKYLVSPGEEIDDWTFQSLKGSSIIGFKCSIPLRIASSILIHSLPTKPCVFLRACQNKWQFIHLDKRSYMHMHIVWFPITNGNFFWWIFQVNSKSIVFFQMFSFWFFFSF